MRRSQVVLAPLLAAAAITTLSGCSGKEVCFPGDSCYQKRASTLFGGFGRSFAEDPWPWFLGAGGVTFLIWQMRSGGS